MSSRVFQLHTAFDETVNEWHFWLSFEHQLTRALACLFVEYMTLIHMYSTAVFLQTNDKGDPESVC